MEPIQGFVSNKLKCRMFMILIFACANDNLRSEFGFEFEQKKKHYEIVK